jgi:DNA-binding beta-propeller fold protein YncE
MVTDLSQLEDRLRAAYSEAAATVGPDDISEHPPTATSQVRWRAAARTASRRGTALAAAAAVLLIVITATVIPQMLQSGSRHTGTAGLLHSHMAYVVTQRDMLIPVNLATGATLKPIPLGVAGGESGESISPDGTMVYVLTVRGQLVPVDVATGKADRPINVGGVSQDLVTTPNRKAAYVLEPPYGVVAVDLANRTALGLIKVHGADGFALTPDGKTLYILGTGGTGPVTTRSSAGLVLTAIDTATNATIATVALTGPDLRRGWYVQLEPSVAMAPDGKTVYVGFELLDARSNRSKAEIVPVDVASNTERTPIDAGQVDAGQGSGGLTISPDSQTGYLQAAGSVIAVDLRTGATLHSIPLPAGLQNGYDLALSPDGRRLYMIQSIDPAVVPVDTATGTPMRPIQLDPPHCQGKADSMACWYAWDGVFAPGGKTLYILSYYFYPKGALIAGQMLPLDAATGAVGKPIDFPAGLQAVVFSP